MVSKQMFDALKDLNCDYIFDVLFSHILIFMFSVHEWNLNHLKHKSVEYTNMLKEVNGGM